MTETPSKVAFLGLGIMGAPMAASLARAGIEVVAWNRTRERAEEMAAEHDSVTVADTAADAAGQAGVAISMVPDVPEVEEVLLGTDGAWDGLGAGGLVVDMSTIAPTASRSIAERLGERGISFLDAPVTGSRPKAEDGTLTIMAGGPEGDFERAKPLFDAMGELIVHVGPHGHGSMVKLINNTLAAVNAAGLAEGLLLAQAAGVDTDRALEVIRAGSGASLMAEIKAQPMLEHDLDPLFKLEHMLKDVRHCIAEARALGIEPKVAAMAESLYSQAADSGLGDRDFAAVIEATAWQKSRNSA